MKKHIAYFTPSQMDPEDLEKMFVVRESYAKKVYKGIQGSAYKKNHHNYLFTGPRGIGKTHLVSLIHNRLSDDHMIRKKLIISRLSEDPYFAGYNDFLALVIRSIDQLNEETKDEMNEIFKVIDEKQIQVALEQLLIKITGKKSLLIIAENFDDILEALKKEGQQKLRAYIQNNANTSFLVTATSLLEELNRRESIFFGSFERIELNPFSVNDAVDLLTKLAHLDNNQKLADFLHSPIGRCRINAIHYLAGGNPRLYAILFEFINPDELDNLVGPFMKMIENLTPFYQSRMDRLAPLQRRIIDVMRRNPHPITPKEIALQAMNPEQSISTQIGNLTKLGYVKSYEKIGRNNYYEMKEPLMRYCLEVKNRNTSTIKSFVDFLRIWFTQAELNTFIQNCGSWSLQYVKQAIALSERESHPLIQTLKTAFNKERNKGNWMGALEFAEEALRLDNKDIEALKQKVQALYHLDHNPQEHLNCYLKIAELEPDNAHNWDWISSLHLRLEESKKALNAAKKACELDTDNIHFLTQYAKCLYKNGKLEESDKIFQKVTQLADEPKSSEEWRSYAYRLWQIGRKTDAIQAYCESIKKNPENLDIWDNLLGAMQDLCLYEQKYKFSKVLLKWFPESARVIVWQGLNYVDLGQYEESVKSYQKAITIEGSAYFKQNGQLPLLWSAWSLGLLGQTSDALEMYEKANEEIQEAKYKEKFTAKILRANLLLRAGHWQQGIEALESILKTYQPSMANLPDFRYCMSLILYSQNHDIWKKHIKLFLEIFDKYDRLPELGKTLVYSIRYTNINWIDSNTARLWLQSWQQLATNLSQMDLPLRLLEASVNYQEKPDSSAFLKLKREERLLIEPWLKNLFSEEDNEFDPILNEFIEEIDITLNKLSKEKKEKAFWSQAAVNIEDIPFEIILSDLDPKANFHLPPLLPSHWKNMSKKAILSFLKDISIKDSRCSLALGKKDLRVKAVRKRQVPFCPGDLYQITVESGNNIGALDLLYNPEAENPVLLLDGESIDLHEALAESFIHFPQTNQEKVSSEYVRFFSNAIRGEEGRFRIIENIKELNYEIDEKIKQKFQRWQLEEDTKDSLVFKGTILYGSTLFNTELKQNKNSEGKLIGTINMLDDEEISENLTDQEAFDGPLRWAVK